MVMITILPSCLCSGKAKVSQRDGNWGSGKTPLYAVLHSPSLCISPSLTVLVKTSFYSCQSHKALVGSGGVWC